MGKQLDLLDIKEEELPTRPLICKYHRWAKSDDFILTESKKLKKKWKCSFCLRIIKTNKDMQNKCWEKEKENLTDYYIRRIFVMGKGNKLPMQEYPQELIDLKRAILQLKKEEVKQEEKKRKKTFVNCKHHGSRKEDEVIKAGLNRSGTIRFKCKECQKESHRDHYERHKDNVKSKVLEWRKNNPELKKEQEKRYRKNMSEEAQKKHKIRMHIQNIKDRDKNKKRAFFDRNNLTDKYIKSLLKDSNGFSNSDINKDLIDLKRITIILKRTIIKRNKNEQSKNKKY